MLSGDNAAIIALATCSVPEKQQKTAITVGAAATIIMRIVLILVAAKLLLLPWFKLIGALLLVYIGVAFDAGRRKAEGGQGAGHFADGDMHHMIADLAISLDNMVAVAAVAMGDMALLVMGLVISIPLVIFGSTLLLKVIEGFPIIVWVGAALLGFIAGELLVSDPVLQEPVARLDAMAGLPARTIGLTTGVVGALLVLALGKARQRRYVA